jgi:2-oxoglutarate ferredoxin oxidoreductase subunit delta
MGEKKFKSIEYADMGILWETYPELCKSCGLCIRKCPTKSLSFNTSENEYLGMPTIKCDAEKCIACHTCENICPECAIKVTGKR